MTQTLVDTSSCSHKSQSEAFDSQSVGEGLRDVAIDSGIGSSTPGLAPEAIGPQSDDVEDVGTVVVKAKKAAQSLWVLMHAQNCRIGGTRCPHKGCVEAKRALLHIKTCPAGNNGYTCPTNYIGCHPSRKLLHHYQKCRELRAKQAGMGRRTKTQQHVCLVCSLVARQAKTVLEGAPPRKPHTKKQVIASFTLPDQGPDLLEPLVRQDSTSDMPPPPPRAIPRSSNHIESSADDSIAPESPPTRNQLMLFSQVAAAAAPPSMAPANPEMLGKSVDSSKTSFLTFAASLALQNLRKAVPTKEGPWSPRRSRAESYDERALELRKSHQLQHRPSANADPTLELDFTGRNNNREMTLDGDEVMMHRRERSSSLGMLASACFPSSSSICDTIEEENGEYREEGAFAMDEDMM